MNTASITLNISLPLDADKSEAIKAIAAIQGFFDDAVSPKDANNINAMIGTTVTENTTAAAVAAPTHDPIPTAITADKNGLPWDERIHSSSKALNADGSWRGKKNCPPALKAKVEAELRGATTANAAPAAELPAVSLPLPPVAAAVAAPAPVENPAFTEFVQFITANTAPLGRIPGPEWVQQTLTAFAVPEGSLANLAHMPDKIPAITAAIKQALGQ